MANDRHLPNQEGKDYADLVSARRSRGTWGGWRPGAGAKPKLKDAVSLTIDVEKRQKAALEEIAEEQSVSIASLVREAIDAFLRRRRRK